MIGRKLKLARSAAGLSLRGLEAEIGNRVTAQAIGKYERGESMPGSGVPLALADALHVSVDYLAGDQELALEGVDFRKKAITSRREEARVLHMLERYLMVEKLRGLSSGEWDKPPGAPYPVAGSLIEAERGADALRHHWGLGVKPIPDLVELLEGRGVKMLSIELAHNIGGLTARVRQASGNAVPVIVVNAGHWGERQRFTLAHELGHLVLSVTGGKVNDEKAAHRFAGAFLMPAAALWAEVGKHRTSVGWGELFELKQLFGVSVQALTYRCKDLGIFNQTLFRRLFNEFKRRGWCDPPYEEPLAVSEGEKPRRFERLCLRALAEGAVSEPKAAELLAISVRELDRRMQEPPEDILLRRAEGGDLSAGRAGQGGETEAGHDRRETVGAGAERGSAASNWPRR